MEHKTRVIEHREAKSSISAALQKIRTWVFIGDGWLMYRPGDWGYTHWEFHFFMNDGTRCVVENVEFADRETAERWLQIYRERIAVAAMLDKPPKQTP